MAAPSGPSHRRGLVSLAYSERQRMQAEACGTRNGRAIRGLARMGRGRNAAPTERRTAGRTAGRPYERPTGWEPVLPRTAGGSRWVLRSLTFVRDDRCGAGLGRRQRPWRSEGRAANCSCPTGNGERPGNHKDRKARRRTANGRRARPTAEGSLRERRHCCENGSLRYGRDDRWGTANG